MDLSFSKTGHLAHYHLGVVVFLKKHVPINLIKRIACTPSSALIVTCYLLDLSLEKCLEILNRRVSSKQEQLIDVDNDDDLINNFLPDDAHKQLNNRLHVSVKRISDKKKLLINHFQTKPHLISLLDVPSFKIKTNSTYQREFLFGQFQPVFDNQTIRISCFESDAEIAPKSTTTTTTKQQGSHSKLFTYQMNNIKINLNLTNARRLIGDFKLGNQDHLFELIEQGYKDAKLFFISNAILKCDTCYEQILVDSSQEDESQLDGTRTPNLLWLKMFECDCIDCSMKRSMVQAVQFERSLLE